MPKLPRTGLYGALSVTDTGTGIDETVRQRVFEPLFHHEGGWQRNGTRSFHNLRHHQTNTTDSSSCDSGTCLGTTFTVFIPLIAGKVDQHTDQGTERSTGGTETILLADDEEIVRNLNRTILKEAGYRVIEAVNNMGNPPALPGFAGGT